MATLTANKSFVIPSNATFGSTPKNSFSLLFFHFPHYSGDVLIICLHKMKESISEFSNLQAETFVI